MPARRITKTEREALKRQLLDWEARQRAIAKATREVDKRRAAAAGAPLVLGALALVGLGALVLWPRRTAQAAEPPPGDPALHIEGEFAVAGFTPQASLGLPARVRVGGPVFSAANCTARVRFINLTDKDISLGIRVWLEPGSPDTFRQENVLRFYSTMINLMPLMENTLEFSPVVPGSDLPGAYRLHVMAVHEAVHEEVHVAGPLHSGVLAEVL